MQKAQLLFLKLHFWRRTLVTTDGKKLNITISTTQFSEEIENEVTTLRSLNSIDIEIPLTFKNQVIQQFQVPTKCRSKI